MIDVQRLYTLNEEFSTKMSAELDGVNNQCETIDELNSKIVEKIMGFMESKCKSVQMKESKISKETLDLIAGRVELIKDGKRDSVEYRNLTKIINKAMRSDLRKYNVQLAQNTIEANCNMKVLRSKMMNGKKEIFKLRDKTGTIQAAVNEMKNKKSPGEDGVPVETIKLGGN